MTKMNKYFQNKHLNEFTKDQWHFETYQDDNSAKIDIISHNFFRRTSNFTTDKLHEHLTDIPYQLMGKAPIQVNSSMCKKTKFNSMCTSKSNLETDAKVHRYIELAQQSKFVNSMYVNSFNMKYKTDCTFSMSNRDIPFIAFEN